MTQIIMSRSIFSSLSRCNPSSQGASLCRSSLDGSFDITSVLIFQRCFFLQDLRRRSRPPTGRKKAIQATRAQRTRTKHSLKSLMAALTGGSALPRTVAHCSSESSAFVVDRCAKESLLRWHTGQSGGTPDSPVNYSGVHSEKLESGWFTLVRTWCTGHCPVAHRTVRCARPGHTRFLCSFVFEPFLVYFIGLS
jgi:hypothetical protein